MKRKFLSALLIGLIAFMAYSEETSVETPAVLIELNSGYSIGINIPNAVPIEMKLSYSFTKFGVTVAFGGDISEENGFHFLIGPTYYPINNNKMRLPVTLGFDVFAENGNYYYGLTGILAYHFVINKNLYIGINADANYYFNKTYEEITGYETKDAALGIDPITGNKIYPADQSGNPIYEITTPIKERLDHWGNYIKIKPMITIGFQM
jgi:hypothetical protein